MEQIKELPDFKEVHDLYKGRRVDAVDSAVQQERLEVPDRGALDKKILDFAARSFSLYKKIDSRSENRFVVEKREGYRECVPIMAEVVDASIPLTMVSMKVFEVGAGEKIDSVQIVLLKGTLVGSSPEDFYKAAQSREADAEFVGDMRLIEKDDGFELAHREINPKFRRQGFGETMLDGTEAFVDEAAKNSQKEMELFLDCSQLDVIYWLWKNDYRPKTDKDWENLDNVLNGGKNLIMLENYFLFEESVPEKDRYYAYPDGAKTPAYHNAYRIRFVKKIKPAMGDEVGGVRQGVSEGVKKLG